MAARGAESKELVIQKILATFSNSFRYDKEIRIPMIENGEEIQLKCVLTCAKVNVECGEDTVIPGTKTSSPAKIELNGFPQVQGVKNPVEPTEEEKKNVETLLGALGF